MNGVLWRIFGMRLFWVVNRKCIFIPLDRGRECDMYDRKKGPFH